VMPGCARRYSGAMVLGLLRYLLSRELGSSAILFTKVGVPLRT